MILMILAAAAMSAGERFDLSCAEATAWGIMHNPQGSTARSGYTAANMFYLGRLTARDDSANWIALVERELASPQGQETHYQEDANTCLNRVSDKLGAGIGKP